MTIDDLETWLVACEDLLATNEGDSDKEQLIRHWISTASAHVSETLEGFSIIAR